MAIQAVVFNYMNKEVTAQLTFENVGDRAISSLSTMALKTTKYLVRLLLCNFTSCSISDIILFNRERNGSIELIQVVF